MCLCDKFRSCSASREVIIADLSSHQKHSDTKLFVWLGVIEGWKWLKNIWHRQLAMLKLKLMAPATIFKEDFFFFLL